MLIDADKCTNNFINNTWIFVQFKCVHDFQGKYANPMYSLHNRLITDCDCIKFFLKQTEE